MKKFIFFFLFSFSAVAASSQILYGVKGGFNAATFTGNDVSSPKFHPSFHIGGYINFLIKEKITLQPEVLFSGKGAGFTGGSYRFGYINIPVLLQYNDPSGFFIEAGPQAGILISAKQKFSGQAAFDVKDIVKSTDYSLVGGIGYKMVRGFGVAARYDFGFFNIANSGIIRNKTILLGILYTFGAGEE